MTSRQHCKFMKVEEGKRCPNRDSILRAPLIPGQECRHFVKKYFCPYYVVDNDRLPRDKHGMPVKEVI